MKKFLQNIVKLKKISIIKDFRFGTFPSISGSGSGSGYTFYRPPQNSDCNYCKKKIKSKLKKIVIIIKKKRL